MKLEITGLNQGYGKKEILFDINAIADAGKVTSILGPNGSGKSTLIKTVTGILPYSVGNVTFDGRELSGLDLGERAKLISYVPQSFSYMSYTSVMETVMTGRTPHMGWEPGDRDLEAVQESLAFMDIESLSDLNINELSGGQRQRVFIARALAQESKFMMFDEPTSSLDIKYQIETMKKLHALAHNRNIGLVVAMHDLNLVLRYSDEVILLKGGRVHSRGSPREIISEESLRDVYGVESEIVEGRDGRTYIHMMDV
ncbi:MAG: ABC transporter ATP-binding protein [Thermoplasmatales archaeon]|nr:ABC transporter ATP-binding protein [Thermoplasmatales archaeon]